MSSDVPVHSQRRWTWSNVLQKKLLCSIAEACDILSIGRTKIYSMLAEGSLPSIRLGTRRLIPVESLRGLIAQASGDLA